MQAGESANPRKRSNPAHDRGGRPAYPRKRAAQACQTCRRRRVKCDNDRPSCSACTKLETECVYRESDKSSYDTASLAILDRLDHLENLLRVSHPDTLGQYDDEPQLNPSPESPSQSPSRLWSTSVGPVDVHAEIHRINVEAVLEWPVVRSLSQTQPCRLASILQASRPINDSTGSRLLSSSDLDVDNTAILLQNFIHNFHIYNPVLEITQIQEYINSTVYNGVGWDTGSCISLLIFSLGTLAIDQGQTSDSSVTFRHSKQFQDAEAFFTAAKKRMGQMLCSSGLAEAQSFFLAGVYLMSTMRPFEAWRLFVQALACCQIFESSTSSDDPHDKTSRLHKSLYWTCFKSELELRLELSITENSAWNLRYPQFFPAPPKGLQSEGEAGWYFYLAEIALRRLGNRILTRTSHFGSAATKVADKVSVVQDFEQQAQSWIDSLPSSLKLNLVPETGLDGQCERLRFILSGHLADCYEMMYWSFMVDAVNGTLSEDEDSNLYAREGFQISVNRIRDNELGFRHRHHGTWLMLRSCTRSALVLVAASRAGLESMLPADWESTIIKVVHLLRYWKDEAIDAGFYLELLEAVSV